MFVAGCGMCFMWCCGVILWVFGFGAPCVDLPCLSCLFALCIGNVGFCWFVLVLVVVCWRVSFSVCCFVVWFEFCWWFVCLLWWFVGACIDFAFARCWKF